MMTPPPLRAAIFHTPLISQNLPADAAAAARGQLGFSSTLFFFSQFSLFRGAPPRLRFQLEFSRHIRRHDRRCRFRCWPATPIFSSRRAYTLAKLPARAAGCRRLPAPCFRFRWRYFRYFASLLLPEFHSCRRQAELKRRYFSPPLSSIASFAPPAADDIFFRALAAICALRALQRSHASQSFREFSSFSSRRFCMRYFLFHIFFFFFSFLRLANI